MPDDGLPTFRAESRQAWRRWLEENHATARGVYLVYAKKSSGRPSVSYDEAVEEALCFGWIDSRVNRLDDEFFQQLITPRKPKSVWSKLNKTRVARLVEEGRMTPAGMAKIEAAQADGSWTALDDVEALIEPEDFARALDAEPAARAAYDRFAPGARKLILTWIAAAKRPETRASRIAEAVRLAALGIPANQPMRKAGG